MANFHDLILYIILLTSECMMFLEKNNSLGLLSRVKLDDSIAAVGSVRTDRRLILLLKYERLMLLGKHNCQGCHPY